MFFQTLIQQIGNTLLILSNNGLYYSDLKDRNILFQQREIYEFYLADFGSIVDFNKKDKVYEAVMTYPPPELKETEGVIYNPKIHQIMPGIIWSFGVLIMQQIPELENLSNILIYTKINSLDEVKFLQKISAYQFDQDLKFLKNILVGCFQPLINRLTLEEILVLLPNTT